MGRAVVGTERREWLLEKRKGIKMKEDENLQMARAFGCLNIENLELNVVLMRLYRLLLIQNN